MSGGVAASQNAAPEDLFDFSRASGAAGGGGAAEGAAAPDDDDDDPFASLDLGDGPPAAPSGGSGRFDVGDAAAPALSGAGAGKGTPAGIGLHPGSDPAPLEAQSPQGYRIKKQDGSIWGPYGLEELKEMASSGSLAPGDQIAKDADEFRLISQYPECAPLLQMASANFQVRTAAVPYRRPSSRGRFGILALLGAAALFCGGVAMQAYAPGTLGPLSSIFEPMASKIVVRVPGLPPNPVEDDLPVFRLEVMDGGGSVVENLEAARRHMAVDTLGGYGEADSDLKRALLLEPGNVEALSRLVLNSAYLTRWHPDASRLTRLASYARYLEAAAPQVALAQMARASALLMEGAGSAPQARHLADAASKALPESVEAKLLAARATNLIDHERAVKLLEALASEADRFPRIETELGLVCEESGDFQCAEKAFQARLERTPGHEEAAGSLANLYLGVGEHRKARAVFLAILKEDSDRVDLEVRLAVMRYQVEGNPRKAASELDRVLRKRLDLADSRTERLAKTQRATLYRLAGKGAAATKLLDEVIASSELDSPAHYQASLLALQEGDTERAADHLASAAGRLPAPALHALKALVANARKDHADALSLARTAAEESPGDLGRALLAVSMLAPAGKPRQAFTQITGLLAIDPIEASGHVGITDYYDGIELLSAVTSGFETLVDREPLQGLSHAALGIARYRAGETRLAKRALQKALELDEQNLPAHIYMGMLAWDEKDYGAAQRSFRAARASDRLSPMPLYLLGRIEEQRGRMKDASKYYTAAKRIDPTFYSVTVRQAILEAKAGKPKEARRKLREVMITHPSSWATRSALYHLE